MPDRISFDVGGTTVDVVMHPYRFKGRTYQFAIRPRIKSDLDVIQEVFEDPIYAQATVRGKTVVDLGGYLGESAVFFAARGATRVHAYEPHPTMAHIARFNLVTNKCQDRVRFYNEAVGTKTERRTILGRPNSAFGNKVPFLDPVRHQVSVQFRSLESILRRSGPVGLLKIDIEGAERHVVPEILATDLIDTVLVESHSPAIRKVVFAHLETIGFELTVEGDRHAQLTLSLWRKHAR